MHPTLPIQTTRCAPHPSYLDLAKGKDPRPVGGLAPKCSLPPTDAPWVPSTCKGPTSVCNTQPNKDRGFTSPCCRDYMSGYQGGKSGEIRKMPVVCQLAMVNRQVSESETRYGVRQRFGTEYCRMTAVWASAFRGFSLVCALCYHCLLQQTVLHCLSFVATCHTVMYVW